MQNLHLVVRRNRLFGGVVAVGFLAPLQCHAQTAAQPKTGSVPAVTAPAKLDAKLNTKPDTKLSDAQAKADLAQAMAATTVVRKGKTFPAPHTTSTGANSKTAASCSPTDTQPFTRVASISIASPNHTKKENKYPDPEDREFYSAPPGWVVLTYSRIQDTTGDPFVAGDSSTPANFSWNSSSTYSSVQTEMHSYVASLNIPDVVKANLNAKIDAMISDISSATYSLSSSSAVLTHHAQVMGVGVINPHTGHSWYTGWLNGNLACAPDYMHSGPALTSMLKSWVNTTLHHTVHFSVAAAID
jgi:hypothetical protein